MAKRKSTKSSSNGKDAAEILDEGTPVTAKEWREGVITPFVLPSKMVVTLRRVGLLDLIVAGSIPEFLTSLAERAINEDKISNLNIQELENYGKLLDIVVIASVVKPKVVANDSLEDQGEALRVNEIPYVDKIQIFNWANGVLSSLVPFREPRKKSVGTLPSSQVSRKLRDQPLKDSGTGE